MASQAGLVPCHVPGVEEELRCGALAVFENRDAGAGRKIALKVVVLPALEPDSKAEPLFDLAGGPGVAATRAARLYATDLKEIRRRRDVVLVDQRGTGGSNPLHCRHDSTPQHFLDEMFPAEYVKGCREELEKKADLTQYTTPIAADDLDDVRAWLGYERIDLIGLSYGTRMALVYMRRYPARIRAAVLMGVTPTYHKLPLFHARDGQRAIDLLLDECAADQDCNRAAPNLRQALEGLLARLGRTPARVQYALPENGRTVTVEIRRDVFAEKLRSRMYDAQNARRLPFVVHQAALGDFGPFLDLAIPTGRANPDFVANGMYLSVTCAEDTAFINPAEAARLNEGTFFGDYRVFQQRRACSMWPRARLPDDYHRPVVSDAPVLIISGDMDPVTPPEWAAEVASHLPNSRHVVIPHEAHAPGGLSNLECLDGMIMDFLDRGDAKAVNASCVDKMLPPPFAFGSAD
ncbi:MAG: alpha/beta hydrolase [Gammaproteobacteria bacterium]